MRRLEELAAALKLLPDVLEQATAQVVQDNRPFLEDANTEQLAAGLTRENQPITPEYAPLTIALKQIKGQPTERVTLRDEGDFYTGILALSDAAELTFVGTDAKTPGLVEKYGEDILGLTDAHIEEFRQDYVLPELQQKTRNTLGL
ncbi:hypothetical protein [Hymenobacter algoricola]|uniref:Uncharacterized protein n=1 Tax=Hymenobacter algoricola TaxID=486267 RepID=A0ABP7N964_9BACT